MAKARKAIPRSVREKVLAEFNHRCAICGEGKPHIHHIDGDPSNNDPANLLPLCPNCHLVDQHDPTSPVDPRKLALFRAFRDPAILSSEFHPLFRRLGFLYRPDEVDDGARSLDDAVQELLGFVRALKMGDFYAGRLHRLLGRPRTGPSWAPNITEAEYRRKMQEDNKAYRRHLLASCDDAVGLVVEMLRYQAWGSRREANRQ